MLVLPNDRGAMIRLLRSPRLSRLFAMGDQGFQGLGNIAAAAILGRNLPQEQFGAVGMAIGAYYFVAGFHRSAVILPYLTEHRVSDDRATEHAYHSDWWWLSFAASIGLSIGLVLASGLLSRASGTLGSLALPLLLGAAMTIPMLAAEFGRRWLYKIERADLAALQSALFFVLLIGGVFVATRNMGDAAGGIAAWAIAATLSAALPLCLLLPGRPSWRRARAEFAPHGRFAAWLSLNIFPYTVYSTATVVLLIGALLGPAAAAVFTAARTLTNPATSIVSAIDSTDKPRATRAFALDGIAGLRRSVNNTRRLLVVLTGGYLVLVALFARPLIDLAFHGQYMGAENPVRWLCLAFFLFCLNQPSETLLIVLRASRSLFVTRLGTAIVTIAALWIAVPYRITGMALAIAVSQLANICFLAIAERRAARSVA